MKQITKDKDNGIKNITENHEVTIKKLNTELNDGIQQIQILTTEKVNVCFTY